MKLSRLEKSPTSKLLKRKKHSQLTCFIWIIFLKKPFGLNQSLAMLSRK